MVARNNISLELGLLVLKLCEFNYGLILIAKNHLDRWFFTADSLLKRGVASF